MASFSREWCDRIEGPLTPDGLVQCFNRSMKAGGTKKPTSNENAGGPRAGVSTTFMPFSLSGPFSTSQESTLVAAPSTRLSYDSSRRAVVGSPLAHVVRNRRDSQSESASALVSYWSHPSESDDIHDLKGIQHSSKQEAPLSKEQHQQQLFLSTSQGQKKHLSSPSIVVAGVEVEVARVTLREELRVQNLLLNSENHDLKGIHALDCDVGLNRFGLKGIQECPDVTYQIGAPRKEQINANFHRDGSSCEIGLSVNCQDFRNGGGRSNNSSHQPSLSSHSYFDNIGDVAALSARSYTMSQSVSRYDDFSQVSNVYPEAMPAPTHKNGRKSDTQKGLFLPIDVSTSTITANPQPFSSLGPVPTNSLTLPSSSFLTVRPISPLLPGLAATSNNDTFSSQSDGATGSLFDQPVQRRSISANLALRRGPASRILPLMGVGVNINNSFTSLSQAAQPNAENSQHGFSVPILDKGDGQGLLSKQVLICGSAVKYAVPSFAAAANAEESSSSMTAVGHIRAISSSSLATSSSARNPAYPPSRPPTTFSYPSALKEKYVPSTWPPFPFGKDQFSRKIAELAMLERSTIRKEDKKDHQGTVNRDLRTLFPTTSSAASYFSSGTYRSNRCTRAEYNENDDSDGPNGEDEGDNDGYRVSSRDEDDGGGKSDRKNRANPDGGANQKAGSGKAMESMRPVTQLALSSSTHKDMDTGLSESSNDVSKVTKMPPIVPSCQNQICMQSESQSGRNHLLSSNDIRANEISPCIPPCSDVAVALVTNTSTSVCPVQISFSGSQNGSSVCIYESAKLPQSNTTSSDVHFRDHEATSIVSTTSHSSEISNPPVMIASNQNVQCTVLPPTDARETNLCNSSSQSHLTSSSHATADERGLMKTIDSIKKNTTEGLSDKFSNLLNIPKNRALASGCSTPSYADDECLTSPSPSPSPNPTPSPVPPSYMEVVAAAIAEYQCNAIPGAHEQQEEEGRCPERMENRIGNKEYIPVVGDDNDNDDDDDNNNNGGDGSGSDGGGIHRGSGGEGKEDNLQEDNNTLETGVAIQDDRQSGTQKAITHMASVFANEPIPHPATLLSTSDGPLTVNTLGKDGSVRGLVGLDQTASACHHTSDAFLNNNYKNVSTLCKRSIVYPRQMVIQQNRHHPQSEQHFHGYGQYRSHGRHHDVKGQGHGHHNPSSFAFSDLVNSDIGDDGKPVGNFISNALSVQIPTALPNDIDHKYKSNSTSTGFPDTSSFAILPSRQHSYRGPATNSASSASSSSSSSSSSTTSSSITSRPLSFQRYHSKTTPPLTIQSIVPQRQPYGRRPPGGTPLLPSI